LFWNYFSILSFQLFIKLKKNESTKCKINELTYGLTSFFISACEAAVVFILHLSSEINICIVPQSLKSETIFAVPLIINIPIGLIAVFKTFSSQNKQEKFSRVAFVLLSILLFWGLSSIFSTLCIFFTPCRSYLIYSELLPLSSGLFIFLSFTGNSYTLTQLKSKNFEEDEITFYFKNETKAALNISSTNKYGKNSCLRSSSVDMLGNFLEDNEKIVKIIRISSSS
jgi:hypothetical protein